MADHSLWYSTASMSNHQVPYLGNLKNTNPSSRAHHQLCNTMEDCCCTLHQLCSSCGLQSLVCHSICPKRRKYLQITLVINDVTGVGQTHLIWLFLPVATSRARYSSASVPVVCVVTSTFRIDITIALRTGSFVFQAIV